MAISNTHAKCPSFHLRGPFRDLRRPFRGLADRFPIKGSLHMAKFYHRLPYIATAHRLAPDIHARRAECYTGSLRWGLGLFEATQCPSCGQGTDVMKSHLFDATQSFFSPFLVRCAATQGRLGNGPLASSVMEERSLGDKEFQFIATQHSVLPTILKFTLLGSRTCPRLGRWLK
jgi:hypothetical protein